MKTYIITKTSLYNSDPLKPHFYSKHGSWRARIAKEVSSMVENMIKKSNIQWYILSAEIALTNFLPFSSQKLSPEVGRNDWGRTWLYRYSQIWVSLISFTKWQECQYVSRTYFADYFHYWLLIYIYFLYTDIHSLMMLWRTFEENKDRSVLCSHLG